MARLAEVAGPGAPRTGRRPGVGPNRLPRLPHTGPRGGARFQLLQRQRHGGARQAQLVGRQGKAAAVRYADEDAQLVNAIHGG